MHTSPLVHREIVLPVDGCDLAADLVWYEEGAPLHAVVIYMDAPGIRPELVQLAQHIAQHGYFCVLPDLYYRLGRIRLDLRRRSERHALLYHTMATTLRRDEVVGDTATMLSFLQSQPQVRAGPVGCLGFSVGGRFACLAAAEFPDLVAAAASICGTGIVTDEMDSPHHSLSKVKGSLLFEFAADDPAVPASSIATLESSLLEGGVDFQIHIEPGTKHGYTFPSRPVYDAAASAGSWRRIFSLLDGSLLG